MDNYIYNVVYQLNNREGVLKSKEYSDIKEIQNDFKITKEQIKNFYMSISAVSHDTIRKIERSVVPIKKPKKIVITFD